METFKPKRLNYWGLKSNPNSTLKDSEENADLILPVNPDWIQFRIILITLACNMESECRKKKGKENDKEPANGTDGLIDDK